MTERVEDNVPKLEWEPSDNIAVYCSTHKTMVFKGNMSNQTGMRVLKARLQEHALWWRMAEHDMRFAAPENAKISIGDYSKNLGD
jgi:hypothetical protein